MSKLNHIFEKNIYWAKQVQQYQPNFFSNLAKQQKPEILWIGCADSRVPANQIIDLPPGEVFVHRNIANVVVHSDLNCLSVIQYAVEILKVKHIIVCGHYGCGGVKAAMEDIDHGLIDNWLQHIKDVYRYHKKHIDELSDENKKFNRLCELNVIEQVANVANTTVVKKAFENNFELSIHGWIYSIHNGILKDLEVNVENNC